MAIRLPADQLKNWSMQLWVNSFEASYMHLHSSSLFQRNIFSSFTTLYLLFLFQSVIPNFVVHLLLLIYVGL